jgi:hypothetical protein
MLKPRVVGRRVYVRRKADLVYIAQPLHDGGIDKGKFGPFVSVRTPKIVVDDLEGLYRKRGMARVWAEKVRMLLYEVGI